MSSSLIYFLSLFVVTCNGYQCWEVKRLYNSLKLANGDIGCCGKPNATVDEHEQCIEKPKNDSLPLLNELGLANRYFDYQDQKWENMDYDWSPSFSQTANMEINKLVSINIPQYREDIQDENDPLYKKNDQELYYTTTRHAVISKQQKTWGLETEHIEGAIEKNYNWLSKNGINFNNPIWSSRNNENEPHIYSLDPLGELEVSPDFVDSSWFYSSYTFEKNGSNPRIEAQNDVCPPIPSPEKLEGATVQIYLKPEYTKKGQLPKKCKIIVSYNLEDHVTSTQRKANYYNQVIVHEIPIVNKPSSKNSVQISNGTIHLHVENLLVQKYTTQKLADLFGVHLESIHKSIDLDMQLSTVYIDRTTQTMKRVMFSEANALLQEESTFSEIKTYTTKEADCEICDNKATISVYGTKLPARNVHKTEILPKYYNGIQFELFGKGYPHGAIYHFWSVNGMFDNGFVSVPSIFSSFSDNLESIPTEHYALASPYHNNMISPVIDSFNRNGKLGPDSKILLGPDIMIHSSMHDIQYSTYGSLMGLTPTNDERSMELRRKNKEEFLIPYTRGYFAGYGTEATAIYAELMSDSRIGDLIFQYRGNRYKDWTDSITSGKPLNGSIGYFGKGDYMSWPMYVFLGSLFDKNIEKGPFAGDKLRTLLKNLYKHLRNLDDKFMKKIGQSVQMLNSYSNNPIVEGFFEKNGIPEYLDSIEPTKILNKVVYESSIEAGLGEHDISDYFDQLVIATVLMANKNKNPSKLCDKYPGYCFDNEVPFINAFSKNSSKPNHGEFLQLAEQAFSPTNIPFEDTNLTPEHVAKEGETHWENGRVMEEIITGRTMMNMLNQLYEQNGEFEVGKEYKAFFQLDSLSSYCFGVGRGFQVTPESSELVSQVYPATNRKSEYVSEAETTFDVKVVSEECPLCELKKVKYSLFERTLETFNGVLGVHVKEQDYFTVKGYESYSLPVFCVTNSGPEKLFLHLKAIAPLEICPFGLCKD